MPFKDPDAQRAAQREWARRHRSGDNRTRRTVEPLLPAEFRVRTAADILELLSAQIEELRRAKLDRVAKARTIGYLCSVALRAVETAGLEARVEAIERTLGTRRLDRQGAA